MNDNQNKRQKSSRSKKTRHDRRVRWTPRPWWVRYDRLKEYKIHWLDHLQSGRDLEPGTRVLIAARVSRKAQKSNGNLRDQIDHLQEFADANDLRVTIRVSHVGSGKQCDERYSDWIDALIDYAKMFHATVLVESADRLLRNREFDPTKDQQMEPTNDEIAELLARFGEVEIASVFPPGSTPKQIRSQQRKRGLRQKKRKQTAEKRQYLNQWDAADWKQWHAAGRPRRTTSEPEEEPEEEVTTKRERVNWSTLRVEKECRNAELQSDDSTNKKSYGLLIICNQIKLFKLCKKAYECLNHKSERRMEHLNQQLHGYFSKANIKKLLHEYQQDRKHEVGL